MSSTTMMFPLHAIAQCPFQDPFRGPFQGPFQGSAAATSHCVPPRVPAFAAADSSQRRTRFHSTATVQPIDCRMTPEERSRSYYSRGELASFSFEVRTIRAVSKARPARCGCTVHSSDRDCASGLGAKNPSLRGLEAYLCPTRNRNRAVARKTLLKFHRKLRSNPNKTEEEKARHLALASAKLSLWSRKVALETARSDSLAVHGADYFTPIDEAVKDAPVTAFCRRMTRDDGDHRQVKRARSCERN